MLDAENNEGDLFKVWIRWNVFGPMKSFTMSAICPALLPNFIPLFDEDPRIGWFYSGVNNHSVQFRQILAGWGLAQRGPQYFCSRMYMHGRMLFTLGEQWDPEGGLYCGEICPVLTRELEYRGVAPVDGEYPRITVPGFDDSKDIRWFKQWSDAGHDSLNVVSMEDTAFTRRMVAEYTAEELQGFRS